MLQRAPHLSLPFVPYGTMKTLWTGAYMTYKQSYFRVVAGNLRVDPTKFV